MLRLQQRRMLLGSKLDLVYEDRLSDVISDELWTTKSAELDQAVRRVCEWGQNWRLAPRAGLEPATLRLTG
jgi:hypothetical protein